MNRTTCAHCGALWTPIRDEAGDRETCVVCARSVYLDRPDQARLKDALARDKRRARNRRYRARDRDRINAQARAAYARRVDGNPTLRAELAAQARAYYWANRDKVLERKRAAYRARKDREARKAHMRDFMREYRLANRDRINDLQRKRYTAKKAARMAQDVQMDAAAD